MPSPVSCRLTQFLSLSDLHLRVSTGLGEPLPCAGPTHLFKSGALPWEEVTRGLSASAVNLRSSGLVGDMGTSVSAEASEVISA